MEKFGYYRILDQSIHNLTNTLLYTIYNIQGDQTVSVHLVITV
jgi:hypothetical protein